MTRAVDRALRLLESLETDGGRVSLTDLARATSLAPSTTARLLDTLETAHFVRRDADGNYRHGSRLLQLGVVAIQRVPLYEVAVPHLTVLADETTETANLAVLDDAGRGLYLHSVPGRHAIRHASWLGRTVPVKGTAIGAVLVGRVGEEGYVATRKTMEPDVTAIAAPITGPLDAIAGAFSVTGPTYRISDGDVEKIGSALVREARAVSTKLGAAADGRREAG